MSLFPSSRRMRLLILHCFHWILAHACSNLRGVREDDGCIDETVRQGGSQSREAMRDARATSTREILMSMWSAFSDATIPVNLICVLLRVRASTTLESPAGIFVFMWLIFDQIMIPPHACGRSETIAGDWSGSQKKASSEVHNTRQLQGNVHHAPSYPHPTDPVRKSSVRM